MNGIISINADEITCSGTITSDLIKANNLLEADTPETISGLWNFTTLPYSSVLAINGTDFTNLNSVNSAISSSLTGYVSISGNQTITGQKVFNANVKLNNTRQLIFGTSSPANINYTTPNLYYDITGGGHYFFNSHSFRTNNTERMTISADANGTLLTFPSGIIMREYTSFDWLLYEMPFGFTLKYKAGGTDIAEFSSGGLIVYETLSMRDGKKLAWDEGFTEVSYIRKDKVNKYLEYDVASTYRHRFSVNGVESAFIDASGVIINSTAVGGAGFPNQLLYLSANKANYIGSSTTDMRYNCSNSGSHNFYQNGTTYLGFINSLGMTLSPNNSQLQLGTTGVVSIGHDNGGTAMQYRIPASWVHNFQIGGVGYAQIRAEGFYSFQNIQNNTALQLGGTNPIRIKHDTASSSVQYIATSSTYAHNFYINGTDLYYELTTGRLKALRGYATKQGIFGAYGGNSFLNHWTGANVQCWIDSTNLGNFVISDKRIKKDMVDARPVLDRLCNLRMIEYDIIEQGIFKDDGRHFGYIAQDIKAEFPEFPSLTTGNGDEFTEDGFIQPMQVNAEFSNLYLKAIQELNAKCITQQTQMEAMQKQIEDQQKQIDQLLILFSQSRI